jgi:hypothetical protein
MAGGCPSCFAEVIEQRLLLAISQGTEKGREVMNTTTMKFTVFAADCFDFEDDWKPYWSGEFDSREAAEAKVAEIEKTAFTAAWIVEQAMQSTPLSEHVSPASVRKAVASPAQKVAACEKGKLGGRPRKSNSK